MGEELVERRCADVPTWRTRAILETGRRTQVIVIGSSTGDQRQDGEEDREATGGGDIPWSMP